VGQNNEGRVEVRIKGKKKFFASLIALVAVFGGGLMVHVFGGDSLAALPRDCDNNSIIYCGATSHAELAQKYNQNKTGDLPAVYNSYGLSASEINNAGSVAKMGAVHKDGRVTVDGATVATNAMSIGRQHKNGSTPLNIAGKTYYNSPPSTSFASPSIVAYVYFHPNGQFKAAIITSCGNPVSGTPLPPPPPPPPAPTYKCVSLTAAKITRTEYNFTATAAVTGGAEVVSYRYDFGDGKSQTVNATTVKHVYEAPGTYTAKLSVNVKVGNEVKTVTAPACQVNVTVAPAPAYACDSLKARTIKLEDRTYAFDLAYTVSGGAALTSVDYDFGDGQTRKEVSPADAQSVTHSYVKAGNYTTVATLHFTAENTVKDVKCQVTITISPEMCPLNPSLPKDHPDCAPCPIPGKEQYPKDSPYCVTPPVTVTELPTTGPMDMVGAGVGLSSMVVAGYYWYASRRDLLTAFLER
jgi:hypothetical protein